MNALSLFHGYLPAVLEGLALTLQLTLASLGVATLLGLAGATAKLSRSKVAQQLAGAYTTLIRGLPELVLMLLVFYGGQVLVNAATDAVGGEHLDVPPLLAGILTIGFIFGAYFTETFRGAILAIPNGQAEAARAFGMSAGQVMRRIVLPQMIRHAIPGFSNNWLVMIKASALVSVIGLDDMVHRAGLAAASTRAPFTFYMTTGAIYLLITSISLLLLRWLQTRYSVGVKRTDF